MTDDLDQSLPPVAQDTLKALEALVLCAGRRVRRGELIEAFYGSMSQEELAQLLSALSLRWQHNGFELALHGDEVWVRAKPDVERIIRAADTDGSSARASRTLIETMAVIAYAQPCTRSDIEQRRGAPVPTTVTDALLKQGWIEVVGQRQDAKAAPLYASTNKFLDDLGLHTIEDLPEVEQVANDPIVSDDFEPYEPWDESEAGDSAPPPAG